MNPMYDTINRWIMPSKVDGGGVVFASTIHLGMSAGFSKK